MVLHVFALLRKNVTWLVIATSRENISWEVVIPSTSIGLLIHSPGKVCIQARLSWIDILAQNKDAGMPVRAGRLLSLVWHGHARWHGWEKCILRSENAFFAAKLNKLIKTDTFLQ